VLVDLSTLLPSFVHFPLFFLLVRRPPSSPLFPYTTLFRSKIELAFEDHRFWDVRRWKIAEHVDKGIVRQVKISAAGAFSYPVFQDRKSTRLNSSHVKISYAVFCLKKKKTDHKKSHNITDES